jgi:cell division ATPase MinD
MVVIGVISAKGGVGKTTVVSNVGASLIRDFGKRVLIIDGNITTPTLGIHLGMLSQEKTLDDVLEGTLTLHQATYIHPCGLHILPASLSMRSKYPDPEVLKDKLEEVKGQYDFIIIDGAAGIGREVISVIQASDTILVVTNPDLTSIVAAIKSIKISKSLNVPIFGLIVNKFTKGKYELKIPDIEELCETKVISTIPYDKKIPESIRRMTPVVLYNNKASSSTAFKQLAALIVGERYGEDSFWKRLIRVFRP